MKIFVKNDYKTLLINTDSRPMETYIPISLQLNIPIQDSTISEYRIKILKDLYLQFVKWSEQNRSWSLPENVGNSFSNYIAPEVLKGKVRNFEKFLSFTFAVILLKSYNRDPPFSQTPIFYENRPESISDDLYECFLSCQSQNSELRPKLSEIFHILSKQYDLLIQNRFGPNEG